MNIACPECSTIFRVDPAKVPDDGVVARCRRCGTAFRVDASLGPTGPGETVTAPRSEQGAGRGDGPAGGDRPEGARPAGGAPGAGAGSTRRAPEVPAFGPQDPDTRARRLARALVSDIKAYHQDRWEAAVEAGDVRTRFRDEIMKSWGEYVEQVGEDMAKKTPYFRNALNEILARGERVF